MGNDDGKEIDGGRRFTVHSFGPLAAMLAALLRIRPYKAVGLSFVFYPYKEHMERQKSQHRATQRPTETYREKDRAIFD